MLIRNADKLITLNELYTFVYEKVRAYSQNMQTPVLAGDADREMPLAEYSLGETWIFRLACLSLPPLLK
jgi:hypothetical protein